MTDVVMRNALACRMFIGWVGKVEFADHGVDAICYEENKKSAELRGKVECLIRENFIVKSKYGYITHVDENLINKTLNIITSHHVGELLRGSYYDRAMYWSFPHPYIYTEFIYDIRRAEQALKFADEMIEQNREGIILSLPIDESLVKILANYESNKKRLERFMEDEFPQAQKEQEEYREELLKLEKIVEECLEEKRSKDKLEEVVKEIPKMQDDFWGTAKAPVQKKSICDRISAWWNS